MTVYVSTSKYRPILYARFVSLVHSMHKSQGGKWANKGLWVAHPIIIHSHLALLLCATRGVIMFGSHEIHPEEKKKVTWKVHNYRSYCRINNVTSLNCQSVNGSNLSKTTRNTWNPIYMIVQVVQVKSGRGSLGFLHVMGVWNLTTPSYIDPCWQTAWLRSTTGLGPEVCFYVGACALSTFRRNLSSALQMSLLIQERQGHKCGSLLHIYG